LSIGGMILRPRRKPCQSTIGESRNWHAGKRIYWGNAASQLSWEEVKRNVRAGIPLSW
jgi:hypothetical protein